MEEYDTIKERAARRAVIEVPKIEAKNAVVKLLTKLPVDDILINKVPVEEVIRKIFACSAKV